MPAPTDPGALIDAAGSLLAGDPIPPDLPDVAVALAIQLAEQRGLPAAAAGIAGTDVPPGLADGLRALASRETAPGDRIAVDVDAGKTLAPGAFGGILALRDRRIVLVGADRDTAAAAALLGHHVEAAGRVPHDTTLHVTAVASGAALERTLNGHAATLAVATKDAHLPPATRKVPGTRRVLGATFPNNGARSAHAVAVYRQDAEAAAPFAELRSAQQLRDLGDSSRAAAPDTEAVRTQARVFAPQAVVFPAAPVELPPLETDEKPFRRWLPPIAYTLRLPDGTITAPAPHPDTLAEPSPLAVISPNGLPPATLPARVATAISDSQLHAVMRALESFRHRLERNGDGNSGDGDRRGFMVGDGTGTGKGRIIAAVIAAAWCDPKLPCRRSVWLSADATLAEDARRDWTDVGGNPALLHRANRHPGDLAALPDGILFMTYAALRNPARRAGLVHWLQRGGDAPVIVFDECHELQTATLSYASQQSTAALKLQDAIPGARILYTSANGFTSARAYGFATRLGLWQTEDYPFKDPADLLAKLQANGTAGLEIMAIDLKERGLLETRALSLDGVETRPLAVRLTDGQKALHDTWSKAFRIVHHHVELAIRETRSDAYGDIPRNRFETLRQAFFTYLVHSHLGPSLIAAIERDLAAGAAPIVQIAHTQSATATRILEQEAADTDTPLGELSLPPDFDLSPVEDTIAAVHDAFPVARKRAERDKHGNVTLHDVVDRHRRPVLDPKAIAARRRAVETLAALPRPLPLIDQLARHFGPRLAEVTGRPYRLQPGADGRLQVERRSSAIGREETEAFLDGHRDVLMFSRAGATGRSYHADPARRNRGRRMHYIAEMSAHVAALVQGIGRSNRTGQLHAPVVIPVATDLPGERKFAAAAARKLQVLGASTRAHVKGQGAAYLPATNNINTPAGRDAIERLYQAIADGTPDAPWDAAAFHDLTGINVHRRIASKRARADAAYLLNRLMAQSYADQHRLIDAYDRLFAVAHAERASTGTLDSGIDTIHAGRPEVIAELAAGRFRYSRIELVEAGWPVHTVPKSSEQKRILANVLDPKQNRGWIIPSEEKTAGRMAVIRLPGRGVIVFDRTRFLLEPDWRLPAGDNPALPPSAVATRIGKRPVRPFRPCLGAARALDDFNPRERLPDRFVSARWLASSTYRRPAFIFSGRIPRFLPTLREGLHIRRLHLANGEVRTCIPMDLDLALRVHQGGDANPPPTTPTSQPRRTREKP